MDQLLDRLRAALADRYTVHREVGRGGMAAVYLADDLKHDRMVALKTIAVDFSTDASAERFQREIRIAARLNHPHILPLYDSGKADGFIYFTMPFVELPTLRARIAREGRLPVLEAVRVLRDVTEALAYAHERGVVHRDIKPDNVFLLTGHATVADFGLAKALSAAGASGALTTEGAMLGTPAYMAPEQLMGDPTSPVDHRTDLYAVGVMACEILTGSRPSLDSPAEELLNRAEPAGVTPVLRQVVLRCLARRPADRWQTAAELMPEWERSLTSSEPATPIPRPSPPRPRRRRVVWASAVLAVGVGGIGIALALVRRDTASPATPSYRQVTFVGDVAAAAISPDGQFVAYMAGQALWLQDLAGGEPIHLVDSVAPRYQDPDMLQWSADGSRIFFVNDVVGRGALLVRRLGGVPQELDMTGFALARLSSDGTRYALWAGPLDSVVIRDVVPGNPQTAIHLHLAGAFIGDLQWSPDDRRLLLLMVDRRELARSLWTVPLDGGPQHVVAAEGPGVHLDSFRWPPDGRAIYYMRGADEVLRVPMSLETGEARGPPQVLLNSGPVRSISLSANGTRAALLRSEGRSNLLRVVLTKDGARETALTRGTWQAFGGRVSPDGRWVAFVAEGDVYRMPADGGKPQRLTYDVGATEAPAWSPDGARIAVPVQGGMGAVRIAVVSADGTSQRILAETQLGLVGTSVHRLAWAPQREILYPAGGGRNYRLVDPESGAERALFDAETERVLFADSVLGWLYHPEFSPDGLLLAFDGGSGGVRNRQSFLWVVSVTGESPRALWNEALPPNRRRLRNEFAHEPVGWSADSRGVYVHDWHFGVLRLVPIDGGEPRVVADLSADCVVDWVAHDASSVICTKDETESDVWIVDGFPSSRLLAVRSRRP